MSAPGRALRYDVAAAVLAVALQMTASPPSATAVEQKPFGVQLEMHTVRKEGVPYAFSQAAGHPWGMSMTVKLASEVLPGPEGPGGIHDVVPTQDPKDIVVNLPPGMLGNPNPRVFPRCPLTVVLAKQRCPTDTQVGVARLRWFGVKQSIAPLVNTTPEKGQSAEFAIETTSSTNGLITAHVVRNGAGYGLTAVSNKIPMVELIEAEITLWGVPADPSHDHMRGEVCEQYSACEAGPSVPSGVLAAPFWTMPSSCSSGAVTANISADSWQQPGRYVSASASLPPVTGCQLLQFKPGIEARPDKLISDAPVGLGVTVKVPQSESTLAPGTPQVRDTSVTLPEGLSISPGIVDGIQACNETGSEGINFEGPLSEEVGLNGEPQLAPGHCPDASTVGTAKAFSPLLDEPIEGHLYLARPGCGGQYQRPCTEQDALDGNLYQLYLELGGVGPLANTGVNLKVRGKVEANPATGQLTSVFEDTPQLPFEKLEIELNGGPRAPLGSPPRCGRATTISDFKPWSAPGLLEGVAVPGTADATPSSSYEVQGCLDPLGFAPGFLAGTVTRQAGKFSAFTLNLSRHDREQYVKGIALHTPPGLLAMLANVSLCAEVQADAGACPEASKIGTTRVASGAGSHPFEIEGTVYLTGPHDGAPFGLSIVTHVVAGPFDLGLIVVRARIEIDRQNATATITTDESGPYKLPQIVFGVPLRLKRVTATVDRPGFILNPTSCSAKHVNTLVSSNQDAVAEVSTPFAVGGCKTLSFKPKFTVSTSGHTSRFNGASLDAKLSYPRGSLGNAANIARVRVSLPKRLPSRLKTLQQACPSALFQANPGRCPRASIVGIARTKTPILRSSLSGPVYFVSHGGEQFPDLVIVLEGERIRVDLTGNTFISKAGITTSTFKTVPDVPVSSFEIYLPEGAYSALAANGNLCKTPTTNPRRVTRIVNGRAVRRSDHIMVKRPANLTMPTEFLAQNRSIFKQDTHITIIGCHVTTSSKRQTR
jgi:hypothetical protein